MARCNLCGFLVVRLHRGPRGLRCLWCRSTFVHRALGLVVSQLRISRDAPIYELSSRGAWARHLRRNYGRVIFSEYYEEVPPGQYLNGVLCQNVERLTFDDGAFALVTSTEVFEHVADDALGFKNVCRVLRPGGVFAFTVPLSGRPATVERARLRGGTIEHLLPPEYHGDRIRGRDAVLAFRNYGDDIVDRLRSAGFARAAICEVRAARCAISGARVVVARKATADEPRMPNGQTQAGICNAIEAGQIEPFQLLAQN
jgi:SAM-dependent methyltransferase